MHPEAAAAADPKPDPVDEGEAVVQPNAQDAATDHEADAEGDAIATGVEIDDDLRVDVDDDGPATESEPPAILAPIDVDDPPGLLPEPEPLVLEASEVAQVLSDIAGADLEPSQVTDADLRRWDAEIAQYRTQGLVRAALIGRAIAARKEALGHGEFGRWVATLGIAPSTATRYMRIADLFFRLVQTATAVAISDLGVPIRSAERTLRALIEDRVPPSALAPAPGTAEVPGDGASTTAPIRAPKQSVRLKAVQSFLCRVRSWPVDTAEDREVISALVVDLQALLAGAEAQA